MLSAIVIDYRSSLLVNGCVRALIAGSLPPDEIIVVDNDSRGGSLEADLAADPRIRLLARDDNPGYAAACNVGAEAASGNQLLFLNADVTVHSDTVEQCVAALGSSDEIGIVTPRLERPDGTFDHACHRGLPTAAASLAYKLGLHRLFPRSQQLGRYTMSWLDRTTDHDIEACSGAFLLISRLDLAAVGGWDERYRFYGEDLDLCLRVTRAGRRVRYLGTVTATHLKGAFSHYAVADRALTDEQRAVKRWAQREVVASHRLFFEEHIRAGSAPPTRWAVELMFTLQAWRLQAVERLARA